MEKEPRKREYHIVNNRGKTPRSVKKDTSVGEKDTSVGESIFEK